MPPKGSKRKSLDQEPEPKAKSKPKGADKDCITEIEVQLKLGESDAQNVPFTTDVLQAWEKVQGHRVFHGIVGKNPIKLGDIGGIQAQFEHKAFQHVFAHAEDGSKSTYVCGINLAWIDFVWTATPCIPVRLGAVKQLVQTIFAKPAPLETIHVAVLSPAYKPLEHKGALKRVSPEEITAAFIMAVARDIDKNEAVEVLSEWKTFMLSTTCKFVFLPNQMDRYWYALDQREQMDHAYRVCHRSCYQRLHEVVRLMERMKLSAAASHVIPQKVEQAYKENLPNMVKGSPGHVTLNFVDTCMTVARRMLNVPEIAKCMQDMDDQSSSGGDLAGMSFVNPFDSHSRLQAILDKCKASQPGALTWCVQGIWYFTRKHMLKTLSIADIRGSAATANRGLIDLLLFKHSARRMLLAKGAELFGHSVWVEDVVAMHTDSFSAWARQEDAGDVLWRSGRSAAEVAWLNMLVEIVFGTLYDAALKLAVKNSKPAATLLESPGISEHYEAIVAKLSASAQGEQKSCEEPAGDGTECDEDKDSEGQDTVQFCIAVAGAEGEENTTKVVNLGDIQEEGRLVVDAILRETRDNLKAQVHFIAQGDPQDGQMHTQFLKTPMATFTSNPVPVADKCNTSEHVAVFFDVKLSGEPSHRPGLRVAPLRQEFYDTLVRMVIARKEVSPEDDAKDASLPEGDIYFIFDGGKMGNSADYLKPFSGRNKVVKTFFLHKEEESVQTRMGKAMGIATAQLTEQLYVISASKPQCRKHSFHHFPGSSFGNTIGPISVPQYEGSWQVKWQHKKLIYSAANLVGVGGKLETQETIQEPEARLKPRTADTKEPVFFHTYPIELYSDLLAALEVKTVIDLTPGDGMLAMAAYRHNAMYLGFAFTEEHVKGLRQHVDKTVMKAMLDEKDELYEPRFRSAVVGARSTDDPKAKAKAKAKGKGKAKAKAKTSKGAKKTQDNDEDLPDEADEGDGDEEDVFSVDDTE